MARREREQESDERSPLRTEYEDAEGRRSRIQVSESEAGVPAPLERQFTLRATVVGLFVGTIVCFSNMYFGLQTGWVSMMSMPSSLIGFAIFKSLKNHLDFPFTPVENVLVQTIAVAVGSMPLSAGFVGVIPALEKLLRPEEGGPLNLSASQLIVWSMGVAFFGVFFAVPLRKQVIIKEKLKFPSGTATALMISVLHGNARLKGVAGSVEEEEEEEEEFRGHYRPESRQQGTPAESNTSWAMKMKILTYSFAVSGGYTLISYFLPILRDLPVFGPTAANTWLWTLNPSPAYIGQGMIMGTSTTIHMLIGAIVGWGILSPLAQRNGWAPGPVEDWKQGSRGWIVWVSLAVMLADSIVSLGGLVAGPIASFIAQYIGKSSGYKILHSEEAFSAHGVESHQGRSNAGLRRRLRRNNTFEGQTDEDADDNLPPENLVSKEVVVTGLILSGLLCIITISLVFNTVPLYATIVAFFIALLLSIMGVRALGQTDLNPVSGISKLTQLFFALIVPATSKNAVLVNLVAGAVSEAGAQQAGDIMQDLKTGHLIGAAPRAQFYGQLIGSAFGAVVSAYIYRLYNSVYEIPSKLFAVPTAYIWIDCSRLIFGQGLPPYAREFSFAFAILFGITTFLRTVSKFKTYNHLLPGGIAFAVGMYNLPSFTLARTIGGLMEWYWRRYMVKTYGDTPLVILASGLILGEGLVSIASLLMASAGVPHF